MSDKELELRCLSVSDWGSEPAMWLRKGDRRRCLTLVMVTVAMSLFALPQGGARSTTPLTYDGDQQRPGTREYRLYHRGYRGPSLSRDGKLLSFAFEGKGVHSSTECRSSCPGWTIDEGGVHVD